MQVDISKDGTLTITAYEPLEVFALIEWQRRRKQGKAKLVIDTESTKEKIEAVLQLYNSEIRAFREWSRTVNQGLSENA